MILGTQAAQCHGGLAMPKYAYLETDVHCPNCGAFISDLVSFQWGSCPGFLQIRDHTYHLGDRIEWRRCADGTIQPWTYFAEGRYREEANIGDPAFENVLTQDFTSFVWEDPARARPCHSCGTLLQGALVVIHGGIIQRVWVYRPGEIESIVQDYIVEADGTIKPMPEWDDHPMDRVDTC